MTLFTTCCAMVKGACLIFLDGVRGLPKQMLAMSLGIGISSFSSFFFEVSSDCRVDGLNKDGGDTRPCLNAENPGLGADWVALVCLVSFPTFEEEESLVAAAVVCLITSTFPVRREEEGLQTESLCCLELREK